MQDNHHYRLAEEVEIDLVELAWELFMQWKPFLLCMILCAALCVPLMYVRSMKSYQDQIAKQQEIQKVVDEIEKKREEEKQKIKEAETVEADIDSLVLKNMQLKQKQDDMKNSITYQLDWKKVRSLRQRYIVKASNMSDLGVILDLNSVALSSQPFREKLMELYDLDDINYFSPISISTPGSVTNGTTAEIVSTVTLMDDTDEKKVAQLISDEVDSICAEVGAAVSGYQVRLFEETVLTSQDSGVLNTQADMKASIAALEKEIEDAVNMLSDKDLKRYEKALGKKVKREKEPEEEEEDLPLTDAEIIAAAALMGEELTESDLALLEDQYTAPRRLSIKYFVLGLFIGGFLYAGVYLLYRILRPCITSNSSVADSLCLLDYGEIHVYRQGSFKDRFFCDPWVWRLKNQKKGSAEEQMEMVANRLRMQNEDSEEIEVLTVPKMTEGTKEIAEKLISSCGKGYHIYQTDAVSQTELEQMLNGCKEAILLFSYGKSAYARADEIVGLCRDYEVNLRGSLLVEG